MENAASIEMLYGGGNHGHLGLIINPTRYQQEDHKVAIASYYTALNVDKVLKKQLVDTVHPMYTSVLCAPLMGFTNISSLAIMQYLYQNYSHVSPAMLAEAHNKLQDKFNLFLPIRVLFTCIDTIQHLASA
eukprot:6687579-Ditylum_brightwellii.AAC.1